MPKRKKPFPPPSQRKKSANPARASIPASIWIMIGTIVVLVAILGYLLVFLEFSNPTTETFVAEVTNVWTQLPFIGRVEADPLLKNLMVDNRNSVKSLFSVLQYFNTR
ncbi:MAG: hypothetical protein KDJ65_35970, partial [Anaerolineae bacterium]|nr:hypothetical protein [Anaerolineae bacterium]